MSSSIPQESQQPQPKKSFWDAIDHFIQSVGPEELKEFPKDGAEQHDHYIYGWPKRKQ